MSRFIISLLMAVVWFSSSPGHAAESKTGRQAEWEKIVAAVRKEGEVRLWGEQEITHPEIIAGFSKDYRSLDP